MLGFDSSDQDANDKVVQSANSRVRNTSSGSTGGLRSPNYPVTDIEEAIERIKKVYKAIRIGTQSYDFIAKSMGYKGISGASRVMVSTLKKFGLLEEGGKDGLRVSEEAKAIIMLPASDPRYIAAVKHCALSPQIFAEMYETYGFDLPDDKPLQFFLVSKKFVPDVAIDVARNFRRTIEYLGRLDPQMQSEDFSQDEQADQESETMQQGRGITKDPTASNSLETKTNKSRSNTSFDYEATAELHVSLPDGGKAHVLFEGIVTRESVERLRDYLGYFAEDQPSRNVNSSKETSLSGNGEDKPTEEE